LHEIFDSFLEEVEVLSPHKGPEKKDAKKMRRPDESLGREETVDDDYSVATSLKQTKTKKKSNLNLVQR
jgi:hypothetical protein